MSYSRWLESNWYVYPCTDDTIIMWRAGEDPVRWKKDETFQEAIEKVRSAIEKDANYEADIQDLKEILQENRSDIEKYIDRWERP